MTSPATASALVRATSLLAARAGVTARRLEELLETVKAIPAPAPDASSEVRRAYEEALSHAVSRWLGRQGITPRGVYGTA